MKFEVITDKPFSLNGICDAPYSKGDIFDVKDDELAEALIRNEIAMAVEESAPAKPAPAVKKTTRKSKSKNQ